MRVLTSLIMLSFWFLISCKDNSKHLNEIELEKQNIVSKAPIQRVALPEPNSWTLVNTTITPASLNHNDSFFYKLQTDDFTKPAYVALDNVKIPDLGGVYEMSFIILSTLDSNTFGFRIQEFYPDRLDVVLDLKSMKVVGKEKSGDFLFDEKINIEELNNNVYKCTITAELYSDFVRILFGPGNNNPRIGFWEASKTQNEEVYIIPSSFQLNLIEH